MRRSFSLTVHSLAAAVSASNLLILALPSTSSALESHHSAYGIVGTELSKQPPAVDVDGEERNEKYPTARALGQSGDGSGGNDQAADAGAADKGAADKGAADAGAGNGNSNNNQHNGQHGGHNKNQHNGQHSGSNSNANQKNGQHNADGNAGKHNGHQGGSNGQHDGKGSSNNHNGQHNDSGSGKHNQHSDQKNGQHNANGNASKHNGQHSGSNGDTDQADARHGGEVDEQQNGDGNLTDHNGRRDGNGGGNGTSWWNNHNWQHLGIGNGNQHGGMHFGNNSLGAHIGQYMDQHKHPSGKFWGQLGGKGNPNNHDEEQAGSTGDDNQLNGQEGNVKNGVNPEDNQSEIPAAALAKSESAESSKGSGGLIVFAVVSGVGVFIAAIRVHLARNHPSRARKVEGRPPTELEDEADAATGDTEGEFVLPNVEFV